MEQLRKSIETERTNVRLNYTSLSFSAGYVIALDWVLSEISRIEALETEKTGNTTPEPLNARNGAEKEEKP